MDKRSPLAVGGLVFTVASLKPGKFLNAFVRPAVVVLKSRFLTYSVDTGSSTSFAASTSVEPFFACTADTLSLAVGSTWNIPSGAFSRYNGTSLNRRYARRLNATRA